MSDDAPRPLTEEERARIFEARYDGGLCGRCGRRLVVGETVWKERVDVDATGGNLRWVPVGAECASPAFRAETEGKEPEGCVGCGRGVYDRTPHALRRRVYCSYRCGRGRRAAHRKEGPSL